MTTDREPPSYIPDVILNPPSEYECIVNEHGVCGFKPNLKYNGSVHRIWVMHAVTGVKHAGSIEKYVDRYTTAPQEARAMTEAVEQALSFYNDYEQVFDQLEQHRNERVQEFFDDNDGVVPPD